jgi:hypothetical protein
MASGSENPGDMLGPVPAPDSLMRLRVALEDMDRAARAAGVEDGDPLAACITCLKAAMECSAAITLEGEARVHAAVAAFEGAAREDRLRMRQATQHCNAETMKLDKMFGTMEIRSHNMVTTVVETMANQVADKMRDRMVIVERQYNRRALWRRAGVLLAAVLAIFSVGCGVMRYADRHAVRLWDQCFEHPYSDRETGAQWCNVGAPLADR